MSPERAAVLDERIAALAKLCKTKGGRKIAKEHGSAIVGLMLMGLPK